MSEDKDEPVVSELPDLGELTLKELRTVILDRLRVLKQIEKPRTNLGGTAPPGRAD